MSRIFKMSIGANLKLLKKIDEKLEKIVKQESKNNTYYRIIVGAETEIKNERYKLAVELQESINQWKRDIGYEEGLKEIDEFNNMLK